MATQELKTNIVLNANGAINNINALKTALESINTMNFTSLAKAFGSLEKAAQTFAENSKTITNAEKQSTKEQNVLLAEKKKILGEISKLYSDTKGKLNDAENASLIKLQDNLSKVVRKIADMKEAMGNLGGAKSEFQTAFTSLQNIGTDGQFGKGIKALEGEYREFIKTLEIVKEKMKAVHDQAVKDSTVQNARKETGRDEQTKKDKEAKELQEKVNATKRRYENLIANLQDKVKSRTNAGDGLFYTEKELAADRNRLKRIVRDFNTAMEALGQKERWSTTELKNPLDKRFNNPLYNNKDITDNGFFKDVNVSKPGNNQSKQSKIDRLNEMLKDEQFRINQRTTGTKEDIAGLHYTDSSYATAIAKIEKIRRLLTNLGATTAEVDKTLSMLGNARRETVSDKEAQKLKRLQEMMANLEKEIARVSNKPILDTQVDRLESKFNRIKSLIQGINADAAKGLDFSKYNFNKETSEQRKQRLSSDKADQKSQIYETGTKTVFEDVKNLDRYKQNIALVTAELNKLNQAELKLNQQANSGKSMRASEYQKLSNAINQAVINIERLTGKNVGDVLGMIKPNNLKIFDEFERKMQAFEAAYDKMVLHQKSTPFGEFYSDDKYQKDLNKLKRLLYELAALKDARMDFDTANKWFDTINKEFARKNMNIKGQNNSAFDTEKNLQELRQIYSLVNKIANLENKALNHKGAGGKFYTPEELAVDRNNLNLYKEALERIVAGRNEKLTDYVPNLNMNMFDNVNVGKAPNSIANLLNTQITQARMNAEQLYVQLQKTGSATDKVRFMNGLRELHQLQSASNQLNNQLKMTENTFQRIKKSIAHSTQWMMQMYVANSLLQMPPNLFENYRELEQAMAGTKQVMPAIENSTRLMAENMEEYTRKTERANQETQNLIGIAHEFARSSQEVVEAATLWGRGYGKKENANGLSDYEINQHSERLASQGYNNDEIQSTIAALNDEQRALNAVATTNELVRQSAMLATVDNFSMEESVKGLEAILAAYDMRARSAAEATLFAGRAVDIVSKVAHNGQISAQDLVRGIEATGKAAQQAGISLSFLSAMIETGVRNTGKSGAEIGNAIKALTVGIHSSKGEKELAKFGIELSKVGDDGEKHLRSAQSVILDIADALQKGEKNAEKMLMAISGGRYQYSKVSAILKDQSEMIRMWGLAASSAGFAQEQLDIQMNTINSKIKQIKASLESLMQSNMGGGFGEVIKNLLTNLDKLIHGLGSFNGILAKAPQIVGFLALLKILPKITSSLNLCKIALTEYKDAATKAGTTNAGFMSAMGSAFSQKMKKSFTGVDPSTTANTQATNANTQATNANSTAKDKNTASENANSASKTKNTVATEANAVAEETSAVSAGGASVAHMGVATAEEIEAGAAASAAAATTALGVAETTVTMGLNILIGLAALWAYNLATATDETKEHIKSLKDLKEVTGNNEESVAEHVDKLQQEISAYQEQQDWMETGKKMYANLRNEIDSTNLSEEERVKKMQNLNDVCSAWNSMMEEYARNTGESFDKINASMENSGEVMEAQQEKYKKIYNEKKQLLKDAKKRQKDFYKNQMDWFKDQTGWYKTNLENFDVWSSQQGIGLNWLQTCWAKFFSTIASGMRGAAKVMADLKSQFQESASKLPDYSPFKWMEEWAAGKFNDAEYAFNTGADTAKWIGTNTLAPIEDMVRQSEAAFRDYELKYAEASYEEAKSLYGIDEDNSVYDDDDGKDKKGEKDSGQKKTKIDEASSDEYKTYHNMLLNRKELSEMGYSFYNLMSFGDMLASMGLDKSKYKGEFGITDEIAQKYNAETDIEDTMTNGALFSMAFSDLYDQEQSAVGAMMKMWNLSEEDAISLSNKIQEAGKANQDAYEISGAYKDYIFSGSIVESKANTKATSALVEEAAKNVLGQTMNLHGVGCVEAVERVGSQYSEFLKDAYDKGIRAVPNLIDYAKEQGVQVIAYDESQLDAGDVVVWRDPNQSNDRDHAGVYTHKNSDGTLMGVDNSSSADEVIERALNQSWRAGQYIIKTGLDTVSNKLSWHRDGKEKAETLAQYRLTPREIREGYERDERSRAEKRFSIREAEIKRLNTWGETSKAGSESVSLLRDKLINLQQEQVEKTKSVTSTLASLLRFSQTNMNFKTWLSGEKINVRDLSIDHLKEVVRLLKAQKDEGANALEKIVANMESLGISKDGSSVAIDEASNKVLEAKLNLYSAYGRKGPEAQYNFDKERAEKEYQYAEAEIKANRTFGKNEYLNEAKRVLYQKQLNAAIKEEARVSKELENSKKNDLAIQKELFDEILKIKERIKEVENSDLDEESKAKKLEKLNAELKELQENFQSLSKNGSEYTQTLTNKWLELGKTVKDVQREMMENVGRVSKETADAIGDAFDDLLLEGKSLQDIVQNILKDIAKVALRNIVYKSLGLAPTATNTWTDALIGGIDRGQRRKYNRVDTLMNYASQYNMNPNWGNVSQGEIGSKIDTLNTTMTTNNQIQQMTGRNTEALNVTQQANTIATETGTLATEQNTIQGTIDTSTQIASDTALTTSENLSRTSNTTATNMNSTAVTNAATQVQTAAATSSAKSAGGGFGGMVGSIFSLGASLFAMSTGGNIPRYAGGGFTNGLISGAGDGTSDSILTYLANRGEFIKTSNGEYIVQKKAVDKLGVGFLDMLNNNPEAIASLKKYANGGALGYEITPSMSPKAANSYKNFTKIKSEKENSPNKRLEELMQQQTNVIASKNNNNGGGSLVVLNTQADSTSVLKALKENPRAVQKILGTQQKHGFR